MKTKNLLSSGLLIFSMAVIVSACYKSNNTYNNGNPGNNKVTITSSGFSPANLTVVTGSTVMWMNNDNMVHSVTTTDGSINSGDIAVGASYTKTFSTAATFNYYDSHNTDMKGVLIVTGSTGGGY